jgi:Protein of unknown function (DUF3768)
MMRSSKTSLMASRVEAMFAETCHHYKIRDGERFGLVLRRVSECFAGNATEVAVRKSGRENEDRSAKRAKIRALNDAFRKTFRGGRVMMTAGVAALENPVRNAVVEKIKAFDAFDDDNDPWGEHDFVSVEHDGQTYFAKIDYYDRKLEAHSEDAADPEKTCRVMTIMLAEEH